MELKDLSKADQDLVNTQFPEDLEKQAAAEVAVAGECMNVGASLAASSVEELEKFAAEKEEEEEDHEKKLDEEHKKEGSIRGAFVARAYINNLIKEGQEKHNDPWTYLAPLIVEKYAMSGRMEAAKAFASKMKGKASEGAGKVLHKMKDFGGKAVEKGKAVAKHKATTHGAALGLGGLAGYHVGKHHKKEEAHA